MPTHYRAEPITQRDGSAQENSNCRLASAATGIDFHTLGAITSTGAKMRSYSGDPEGGTTSDDAVRAWGNGYDQDLRVRDGRSWADAEADLDAGRVVHLDVWAATVGGPCLSGSGSYGHTIAVAPERDGDRWLVADPWCKPPKWAWVDRDQLRAGAEKWASKCGRESQASGGPRDIRDIPRDDLMRIVKRLMDRWTPDHPADDEDDDPGSTGGSAAILFTTTRAREGASDMTINASGRVTTGYSIALEAGCSWYGDSALGEKLGELSSDRVLPYVGIPTGSDARAILLTTSKPYDDDEDRPSIVYVRKDAGDPVAIDVAPDDPGEVAMLREAIEDMIATGTEALDVGADQTP